MEPTTPMRASGAFWTTLGLLAASFVFGLLIGPHLATLAVGLGLVCLLLPRVRVGTTGFAASFLASPVQSLAQRSAPRGPRISDRRLQRWALWAQVCSLPVGVLALIVAAVALLK